MVLFEENILNYIFKVVHCRRESCFSLKIIPFNTGCEIRKFLASCCMRHNKVDHGATIIASIPNRVF